MKPPESQSAPTPTKNRPGLALSMMKSHSLSEIYQDFSPNFAAAENVNAMVSPEFIRDTIAGLPPRDQFLYTLVELRDELDAVLQHADDAEELEHQATLFWPSLAKLHPWIGMGLREGELIAYFDLVRVQFRMKPVSVAALQGLRDALNRAATAPQLSTEVVDECLDRLEDGGVDLRLPLAFTQTEDV